MNSIAGSGGVGTDSDFIGRRFAIAQKLRNPSGNWVAWAVVSFIAFFAVGWMTFVDVRPFWVVTTDPEQDYYYNSLAILETGFPTSVRHPGTLVYYLGSAVLAVNGTDTGDAQRFFNSTYVLAISLFVFSLAFFTRKVLRGIPFAPSFLILSSLLLWPSFLTYSNHFSVESFMLAISVVTSAYVYSFLIGKFDVSARSLLVYGILIGLGTALKFTFAPIGISIGIMIIARILGPDQTSSLKYKILLSVRTSVVLGLVSAISFLLFVLPVVPYLYEFFGRLGIEATKSSGSEPIITLLGRVFQLAPEYGILLLIALIGFGVCYVGRKFALTDAATVDSNARQMPVVVPTVALLITLFVCGLIELRSVLDPQAVEYADSGVYLRNLTPIAGFLPLLLLVIWKRYVPIRRGFSNSKFDKFAYSLLPVIVSVLLIVSSVGRYFSWREAAYYDIRQSVMQHQDALRTIVPSGERVAIWDNGQAFGEPMFFFWGNYRYAIDQFDEKLLTAFPQHTIARFREINGLLAQSKWGEEANLTATPTAHLQGILRGSMQEIYDSAIKDWKQRFPRRSRTHELITGEDRYDDISVVMYRPGNVSFSSVDTVDAETQIRMLFADRFGEVSTSQFKIGNEIWSIIDLPARR